MESKNGDKTRGILKAFAAGRSCEQILANDSTVTYHDIFRAITIAPTSYWTKRSGSAFSGFTWQITSPRTTALGNRRD